MNFVLDECLRCPLDQRPLQLQGRTLRCEQGHSFDVARQGYVNLLGAGDKRSRDPGDSKEMIVARREFLEAGHYAPVADTLGELLHARLVEGARVVDAGCGEGYYLHRLYEQIDRAVRGAVHITGYDISKWALQAGARRFPATWVVASNRSIPLADNSADLLLCMFGFPDYTTVQHTGDQLKLFARLRFGKSDLGVNRKRLEAVLSRVVE